MSNDNKHSAGGIFNYEAQINCYNNAVCRFEFHADNAKLAEDHIKHIINCDTTDGFEWKKPPTQIFYIRYQKKGNKTYKYIYSLAPFDALKNREKPISEIMAESYRYKSTLQSILDMKRSEFSFEEMADKIKEALK